LFSYASGFSQSLRRIVGGFGSILAPLWAGSLLDSPKHLYIMFSVALALQLLIVVSLYVLLMQLTPKNVQLLCFDKMYKYDQLVLLFSGYGSIVIQEIESGASVYLTR